jgi:glycosyltransferase involved in cell wall biosynthesis
VDTLYFHRIIEPMISDPLVKFVGEVADADKNALLAGAAALLFPIDWPEPFGLVMIEAMACGTPVIAWDHGSVSEVIDDGETGFVVRSEDEAVEAVKRIPTIDRRRVRAVFEQRFSSTAMANRYLQVYAQLRSGEPTSEHSALAELRSPGPRSLPRAHG